MMTALGKHSLIDLKIKATGDTDIDAHHTVEDIAFPAPIHVGEKLGYMANLDQSWVGVDVTEVFSEAAP